MAGCKTGAFGRGPDDSGWALLSDIHISKDPNTVVREVNMTRNLERAVAAVRNLGKRPAGALVCGDCAYSTGQTEDYQQVAGLMKPLQQAGMPVHLALGNHDNRERFRAALPEPRAAALDRVVALIETRRANWIILDSLEQTNVTPGLLGDEQLGWLASTLDAHPRKPALVMVHHNPGVSGNMGLKDTVKLFEVIRSRKQVKAYIYGHTHVWAVGQDASGIHLINLPAVAYTFRADEASGWVAARLEPDALHLKFHSLTPGHAYEGQEHALRYRNV